MASGTLMYHNIHVSMQQLFPNFKNRNITDIPNCEQLNRGFECNNLNKKQLTFVQQDKTLEHPEMGYEERIYRKGIIATRSHNWHDFFNAMVWHKFPKTKVAINAIHFEQMQLQQDNRRSRQRDLLTLFDECGVIIVAKSRKLELLRQHNWQALFVENKNAWMNEEIQIVTFGHAMYEKYLNPYIGMTAKALVLESMPLNLDGFLSEGLLNQTILQSKAELLPLPVLGIPGWHKNQNSDFYANKNYFRSL